MISVASLSPCFIGVCISLILFTLHSSHFPHSRHLWSAGWVCLRNININEVLRFKCEEAKDQRGCYLPRPMKSVSVETGKDLYFLAQKTVLFPSNVEVGIPSLLGLCSAQGWAAKPTPAASYPGKQLPRLNILICQIDSKTCQNTYQVLTDLCSNSTSLIPEPVNCCCPWC